MSFTEECEVCLEDVKNAVECKNCALKVCKSCTKRYLLESPQEAHCMRCHIGWTRLFLLSVLPKTWVNGTKEGQYRHSRKQLLLDREKALIPQTIAQSLPKIHESREETRKNHLEYAQLLKDRAEYNQSLAEILLLKAELAIPGDDDAVKKAKMRIEELTKQTERLYPRTEKGVQAEIRKVSREIRKVSRAWPPDPKHKLELELEELKRTQQLSGRTGSRTPSYKEILSGKTRKRGYAVKLVCPCPVEGCRGLVLPNHTCGVCTRKICKQCHELSDEGHVCSQEAVATVKALKADTKPCPKCAVAIMLLEGCDQMFCTNCNVVFSWRSGKLLTNTRVHNPHAIEWMQRTGRKVKGQLIDYCGGVPFFGRQMMMVVHNAFEAHDSALFCQDGLYPFNRVLQSVGHTDNLLQSYPNPDPFNLEVLRVRYLMRDITEEGWARAILTHEKERKTREKMEELFNLYRNLLCERLRALAKGHTPPEEFVKDVIDLRDFINDVFEKEMAELGSKKKFRLTKTFAWSV